MSGFKRPLYWAKYGSPTWTRTRDKRINSPLLYQLSYQGMMFLFTTAILAMLHYFVGQPASVFAAHPTGHQGIVLKTSRFEGRYITDSALIGQH